MSVIFLSCVQERMLRKLHVFLLDFVEKTTSKMKKKVLADIESPAFSTLIS